MLLALKRMTIKTVLTGVLVHTFIMTSEKVRCRSVTETNQSSSMCFGGLLSHVIGGEAKALKGSSWDNLLCSTLKLACSIVQNPLVRNLGHMALKFLLCQSVSENKYGYLKFIN